MNIEKLISIRQTLKKYDAQLIAVSKTKPVEAILELYKENQRIFGENKVQEMVSKQDVLPKDIEWHFIGHLQSNKVKYIAPFVNLIHSVDSLKLLKEINKQAKNNNRKINCLIQIYIATEETKFGMTEKEIDDLFQLYKSDEIQNINIVGLMGMATFTDNKSQIKKEFAFLKTMLNLIKNNYQLNEDFNELSMGMSGDFEIALAEGSTMVRIGSALFGSRI